MRISVVRRAVQIGVVLSGGVAFILATPAQTPSGTAADRAADGATAAPTPAHGPVLAWGPMPCMRLDFPMPVYPKEAKEKRISGQVVLHIVVAKNGRVRLAEVVSGPQLLQQVALDAVRRWRFVPCRRVGELVEMDQTISVNFQLGDGDVVKVTGAQPIVRPPPSPTMRSVQAVVRIPAEEMVARLIKQAALIPTACDMCAHVGGTVVLRVLVGADGHVRRATAISGPEMLKAMVIKSVRQWVYRPYLVNGMATTVETTVAVPVNINDY